MQHINKLLLEMRFSEANVKKLINELKKRLGLEYDYSYKVSGGTADIYEYGDDKVVRISSSYGIDDAELYDKLVQIDFHHVVNFLKHVDLQLKRSGETVYKTFSALVMEKLTPLDQVFVQYDIPSISVAKTPKRHPFTVFTMIVGEQIANGIRDADEILSMNIKEFTKSIHELYVVELPIDKWREYRIDPMVKEMIEHVIKGVQECEQHIPDYKPWDISFDNIMYDESKEIFKLIDVI